MSIYRHLIFPLLARQDPEAAHERALGFLERAQAHPAGRAFLRTLAGSLPGAPVTCAGLTFPNPIGLAAGFDKDVRVTTAMALLGFGHIEVGTLTPRPQPGNPRPRLFRLPAQRAIINRMGFPNAGIDAALPRLRALAYSPRSFVLGVSLGKQKETPLPEAARDYESLMSAVYPHADYLAVNISSPNTPGLRELQGAQYIRQLLLRLLDHRTILESQHDLPRRPLFVKLSPDLSDAELETTVDALLALGVEGVIATNTTLAREHLDPAIPNAVEAGGLSGRPLAARSLEVVRRIAHHTGGRLPIIGVGGIDSPASARAMLDAGASLAQLYTGFVYQGPRLPGRIVRDLATRSP